ncbi:MAG: hypothetical protein K2F87_04120 [Muribaculaceae bacterium]|nr:hypothetical protein [Muribaculaceae bacterium]
MLIFLIISSCLLWVGAFAAFPRKILLAPALSYCALLVLSFARKNGYPILPVSSGMSLSWLCITLVVMLIIVLQNPAMRAQSRGTGYMLLGAVAGMAVGLMGYTFSASLNLLYAIMLICTAIGTALGLLLFSNTPDGRLIAPGSGHFWKYLLAKGFPALITVAQLGIAGVILIAAHI